LPSRTTQFQHTKFEKRYQAGAAPADQKGQKAAPVQRKRRTAEEVRREARAKLSEMQSKPMTERAKEFKWRKRPFQQQTRKDKLSLTHYRHAREDIDRINKHFSKFNTRTNVITYESSREYVDAKLDQLPSSTSWSKEETDCLMYLCQKFNLRFLVIADRFASFLKDRYDRRQIESLIAYKDSLGEELQHEGLKDDQQNEAGGKADENTREQNQREQESIRQQIDLLSKPKKSKYKKRDLKAIEKGIWFSKMDAKVFDKTVEEVKHRYYEVARALLQHRGESAHPMLKNYEKYDIEYETIRKANWQRVFSRGKELYQKEKYLVEEHLKLEAQIRRIEQQDAKK